MRTVEAASAVHSDETNTNTADAVLTGRPGNQHNNIVVSTFVISQWNTHISSNIATDLCPAHRRSRSRLSSKVTRGEREDLVLSFLLRWMSRSLVETVDRNYQVVRPNCGTRCNSHILQRFGGTHGFAVGKVKSHRRTPQSPNPCCSLYHSLE